MRAKVLSALSVVYTLICICSSKPSPFDTECVQGTYPPKGRPDVPSYVINLDQAPNVRWNQVVKDKGAAMKNLLETVKSYLRAFGSFTQKLIDLVDHDLAYLVDTFPDPYGDEMRGIASASGMNLGEVVLYNIFYEVFTVCTSIVAEDPSGQIFHARNLDFGLFLGWNPKTHSWAVTDALRPLIVHLDFQRSGKTIFKAVNYVGYTGVVTGMNPGLFSITMNERFNIDGGFIGIVEWILGKRDIQWVSHLIRNTLQDATSYEQAKDKLANSTILAPAYFILGGSTSKQGCVITRSRDKAVDVWNLGTGNSSWFLLETNYDHWEPPFILDDRATPGNKCMNKLTQKGVNFAGIYDVLNSRPVLNKLTTYTTLMQVSSGKLETWLQYCPEPCPPW